MKPFRQLLLGAGLVAAAAAPAAEPPADVSDSALRIRGIFDANLPGTERKNSLRFIVHPHLGDLSNRDYLRTPLGVRYGLTQNWEATAEVESYFSHGFGDVPAFEKFGLSQIHVGTKYRLGEKLWRGWDTAVGLDYTHPLGNPPPDVTDGLVHIAPFITFAHALEKYPNVRVFWGLGADLVNHTATPGILQKNQLGDDAGSVTLGAVWTRGPLHYTLEATTTTTTGLGGPIDGTVFTLRPGVVWEIPRKYTFHAKGQWLVGFGLRLTEGPDGFDVGASAKVRVNFDFKRLFGLRRGTARP